MDIRNERDKLEVDKMRIDLMNNNKPKIEILKSRQKELDEELVNCPKCGEKISWGELKEFGNCLDCYYKEDKSRGNKQ